MADENKLRVNYYVGAMLAQGGDVRLEESKIVFSPTSPIDRAMGATDVEIPFQIIKGLEHRGQMSRTFHVKTDKKVHKFEGSHAKKLAHLLQKAMNTQGFNIRFVERSDVPQQQSPVNLTTPCKSCQTPLKFEYVFCPSCGTAAKTVCPSCHRVTEKAWKVCVYCGLKLTPQP